MISLVMIDVVLLIVSPLGGSQEAKSRCVGLACMVESQLNLEDQNS